MCGYVVMANRSIEKNTYIDYAGPGKNGQMYFVVVGAFSKYLEIVPMFETDTTKTIEN